MKKLNDGFYEIEPELYAEAREGRWFITDEESEEVAGPFESLEALKDVVSRAGSMAARDRGAFPLSHYIERAAEAGHAAEVIRANGLTLVANTTGRPEVVVTADQAEDLVTLREAAEHVGMTRQGLEYRRKKGILGVDPVVTGRSVELYSLRALKEKYPS